MENSSSECNSLCSQAHRKPVREQMHASPFLVLIRDSKGRIKKKKKKACIKCFFLSTFLPAVVNLRD